jgi:multiple sugar transport system permease protein
MKRAYLFVGPALAHLLVFALVPIVYALGLSFYKWDILRGSRPFVGTKNYADALAEPAFWNAMWNSTRYALASVPLGMAVALAIAVLVAQKLPGVAIFRTIFYVPAISSGVAISMLWIYVYLPEKGLMNALLGWFGLPRTTDFLNEPAWAMWALVFMSIWTGLGPRMVLYLAGLLAIPPSLYEAASIDGASSWRSFWNITMPMLAPTSLFVLVTSTIAAFQVFTPVYMMTKGGPMDTTDVIGYHIYAEAWQRFHVGLASAKSFLLLVVIGLASWLQFRLMRRQMEGYEAGS